jgi:ABC-2 type transport system permease protein
MAVYKRGYQGYEGKLTPEWSRFLVIARQAFRGVSGSRSLISFYLLCFVCPIVCAILVYIPHNAGAIAAFGIRRLPVSGPEFYYRYLSFQSFLAFLLTAFVGPGLVSVDLANNSLPLYFCRPFSRAEYVVGKMTVLATLMSAVTWVPGLALFGFQSYLEGWAWFRDNLNIAAALFFGSWIWILLLCLLALAMSAWVKWRLAAGALILATMFVTSGIGEAVHATLGTGIGDLISLMRDVEVIWFVMFGLPNRLEISLEGALGAITAASALFLYLLARKIRAYEVERS